MGSCRRLLVAILLSLLGCCALKALPSALRHSKAPFSPVIAEQRPSAANSRALRMCESTETEPEVPFNFIDTAPVFKHGNVFSRSALKERPAAAVNEQIIASTVRVVANGAEGEDEALGVMSLEEALAEAETRQLDLIMLNDKIEPPLCRIDDYGKFRYATEKKIKETARKQAVNQAEIKEIKMGYKIGEADFQVRVKMALRFLADGDKVRVAAVYRGREGSRREIGRELLQRVLTAVGNVAKVESEPKDEGRAGFIMLLAPKKGGKNR